MLNDLNRVDFGNVQEQASWVCQCDANMVQKLEGEFKATLQEQVLISLKKCFSKAQPKQNDYNYWWIFKCLF